MSLFYRKWKIKAQRNGQNGFLRLKSRAWSQGLLDLCIHIQSFYPHLPCTAVCWALGNGMQSVWALVSSEFTGLILHCRVMTMNSRQSSPSAVIPTGFSQGPGVTCVTMAGPPAGPEPGMELRWERGAPE